MRYLVPLALTSSLVLAACTSSTVGNTEDMNSSSSLVSTVSSDSSSADDSSSSSTARASSVPSSATTSNSAVQARVIEMTVTDWQFSQSTITAKKGEKVIVRLTGIDGTHSFASKDLGINVAVNAGETKDIVLPTDKEGTFAFRCAIPCGPGHMDMKGNIVIEA